MTETATDASERQYAAHWRRTRESASDLRDGNVLAAVMDLGRATWHLTAAVVCLVLAAVAIAFRTASIAVTFAWEQTTGWIENIWEYRRKASWTDVVPPAVERTVKWLIDIIPDAFGLRGASAYDQVAANIVLIAVSIATSLFTGGITIAFVLFWTVLLLYAFFFRETPEGDRLHRKTLRAISSPLPINLGGGGR